MPLETPDAGYVAHRLALRPATQGCEFASASRPAAVPQAPIIETELKAGWTAKAIYERHSAKLTAISYPQFVRYCRQLRQPSPDAKPAPADPPPPPPATPSGSTDVGRQQPRTFKHESQVTKAAHERMFGSELEREGFGR